jgi:hypothetical protein
MIDLFGSRTVLFAVFITALAKLLEPGRQKLFLDWLYAHSDQAIKRPGLNRIQDDMVDWFESLSEADVLREYYLVTCEVRWWRDLEEGALATMLDK